jgi:hypothetical protein
LRVAALAFGVLAGLVASLILALGGLDVSADVAGAGDRQGQAIRFGLFVIGNLGVFGAALVLAAPLAGAVFLVLAGVAWVGASLLMGHSTDLVLITPPALLLVATIFATIAHFRRPRPDADEDPDVEIISPAKAERGRASDPMDGEDEEVGIPAFAAAEQKPEPALRSAFDDDRGRPQSADWNPRKRPPPPPRAKPAFRPIEEEYEDDEPSGFSRFALGVSGVLSFGLYAALAGAAVLIFWSVRNEPEAPAATVAEAPAITSSSAAPAPAPSSSEPERLPTTEQTLQPILTAEPIRQVETSGAAPSPSPSELVAETVTSQEPGTFGTVSLPDGPVAIPALADDFSSDDEATALPPVSADVPALPAEEPVSEEPVPLELEADRPAPSVAAPGQPLPRAVPLAMAAQRAAAGTGPVLVVTPPTNANNTGL